MKYALILLLGTTMTTAANCTRRLDVVVITGKVTDEKGMPAAGVEVASFWEMSGARPRAVFDRATTDSQGRFTLRLEGAIGLEEARVVVKTTEPPGIEMALDELPSLGEEGKAFVLRISPKTVALLAIDQEWNRGGVAIVDLGKAEESVIIRLTRLARVSGKVEVKGAGAKAKLLVGVSAGPVDIAQSAMSSGEFTLNLPAGRYDLLVAADDAQEIEAAAIVSETASDVDLGTLTLVPTELAQKFGKPAPDWVVTEARGVERTLSIKDLRGKWVLLEFWGYS